MRPQLFFLGALVFAVSACSGDKGASGIKGVDGNPGDKGDPGTPGKNGTNGTNGKDGANGTNGTNGADGAPGANGMDGTNGAMGADGAPGANGADGNDIILSENARTGLALSEVAVDLTGLDGDAIESVGRGSYLINAIADCKGCHNGTGPQGQTLFLAGNVDFAIGGPNHVFTRNLTPDPTTGLKLTEDQFVKALRTGTDFKDATGATALIVMPWAQLRWMTDQDLRDMYHYLKHIPAVENAVLSDTKPTIPPSLAPFYDNAGVAIAVPVFADGAKDRPLPSAFDPVAGKPTVAAGEEYDSNNVLRGLAISPLNDDTLVAGLSATDQALYGRGSYIVNGPGLCNECHTAGGRNQNGTVKVTTFLTGGQAFAVPPPLQPILKQVRTMSANLTGPNNGFSAPFSVFLDTWLAGVAFSTPPHALGFPMPFDVFRNMTNADKEAVYMYMHTIQDNGLVTGTDVAHQAPARYCTTATVATDCAVGETCAAVTILGATGECVGATCTADSDCGACQTCVGGPKACVAEDPGSACAMNSL